MKQLNAGDLAVYWPRYKRGALPVACVVDSWTRSRTRVRVILKDSPYRIAPVKPKYLTFAAPGLA